MDYPKHTLDTPFGTVVITPHDADELSVTTPYDINGHSRTITVNTVDHYLNLTLHDYGNGFEQKQNEYGHPDYRCFDLSRADWIAAGHSNSESSGAARKKIVRDLIPLVAAWAKQNPEALSAARLVKATEELHRLFRERQVAEERLAQLADKIAAAEAQVELASRHLTAVA